MERALLIAAAPLVAALLPGMLVAGCTEDAERARPPAAAPPASPPAAPPAATAVAATPTPVPTSTAPTPAPTPAPTAGPAPGPTPRAAQAPAPPAEVLFVDAPLGRSFDRPTDARAYPGGRVLIAEQSGLVLALDAGGGGGHVFLDLRRQVSRDGNEEGLLGLAVDPDVAATGWIYAYYSVRGGERRTRLARFSAADGLADAASELVILEIAQPFSNHNGGALRFGPDGMLYIGVGDGGSAGDPGGNGQDLGTLLGSILRIDVRSASPAQRYRIPDDNPFVGVEGARGEIWAYGLRNPWRMAFDPGSGALWVGDVGQNRIEEVDRIVRGGNYGWNRLEGDDCYRPREGCDPEGMEPPVATYDHREGCSVTGGVVYRGRAVPELDGAYVFGDFCSGRVWAMDASGEGPAVRVADTGVSISSFAQIGEELWLLRFDGPVLRAVSP